MYFFKKVLGPTEHNHVGNLAQINHFKLVNNKIRFQVHIQIIVKKNLTFVYVSPHKNIVLEDIC